MRWSWSKGIGSGLKLALIPTSTFIRGFGKPKRQRRTPSLRKSKSQSHASRDEIGYALGALNHLRQFDGERLNMNHIPDELKERKIVLVKHAAETAGVDQRTLLKRLSECAIPVIHLGPRRRALMLSDFDRLISSLSRTNQPEAALKNQSRINVNAI
jgi:hypothetical protein